MIDKLVSGLESMQEELYYGISGSLFDSVVSIGVQYGAKKILDGLKYGYTKITDYTGFSEYKVRVKEHIGSYEVPLFRGIQKYLMKYHSIEVHEFDYNPQQHDSRWVETSFDITDSAKINGSMDFMFNGVWIHYELNPAANYRENKFSSPFTEPVYLDKPCHEIVLSCRDYQKLLEFVKLVETNVHDMSSPPKQISVYEQDHGSWVSSDLTVKTKLNNLPMEPRIREDFYSDVHRFTNDKEYYGRLGLPYKRGYLFYGLPGCGKTLTIYALANMLNKHVYRITNLNIEYHTLRSLLRNIPKGNIVVFEDIDTMGEIFRQRETVESADYFEIKKFGMERSDGPSDKTNRMVSLGDILTYLDGNTEEGNIFIITTNYPEVLDKALIRPGRCDVKVKFGECSEIMLREMFKFVFDREPSIQISSDLFGKYTPALVMSVFNKNRFEPDETKVWNALKIETDK